MSRLTRTLIDLNENLSRLKIPFLVTRFDLKTDRQPSDLDILVQPRDFDEIIAIMSRAGYVASSHDKALGGRQKGAQVNLTKESRTKIDLHLDFTWRGKKYVDNAFLWSGRVPTVINGIGVTTPHENKDALLVAINVLFEKEYITKSDWDYLRRAFNPNNAFQNQAEKFGWGKSYTLFRKWWKKGKADKFPIFLPAWLVGISYLEKFDPVSALYYLFFRIRFSLSGRLPYE